MHATTPILLLDERGAAAMLGMTPRTLQEWRRVGSGPPYVRISSRCVRYRVADLESWAAERVRTSTSAEAAARDAA
jgi:predicted DNA-binding transcriptional regulator AlpA